IFLLYYVYRPGLDGPYVFDDFQNISRNPKVAIDSLSWDELLSAAFSKVESGAGRPIAMVSFALNYFFAGKSFHTFPFKLTNLVIHAVNALLVFFLVRTLLRERITGSGAQPPSSAERQAVFAALFAAALWGLHPLQLTSVLYTVQRMTSMAAFFTLAGMLVFVHGRQQLGESHWRGFGLMAAGLAGGVGLGVLCKENAVLLPVLAAIVEFFFFKRTSIPDPVRRKLILFYVGLVAIPVLVVVLYLVLNPDFILKGYLTRNFELVERLLTQSRALFFYLSLIIFPIISRFGLYHDDFQLSTGILTPPSTLIALIAWALIAVALARGLKHRPLWAFGLLWFLAAHAIESSIISLELIHEHRNYLPSVGICAVGAHYLSLLAERKLVSARSVVSISLCVLLVFAFVTHTRAQAWSSRSLLYEVMAKHHPGSYRALFGLATSMREEQRDARAIYKVLRDAALVSPATVYPLIEMSKMLQALIAVSDRVNAAVPPPAVHASGELWAADPVLDRKHLLEVDQALANEISRRLGAGNRHIQTVYSLWTAQTCVLDRREQCLPLQDRLLDWHYTALETLPAASMHRATLELSAAKLLAARGEIEKALVYVDRAIDTTSGNPRFRAQKAMLLVKLGQIEEAERVTVEIEQKMDWRRQYVREVEVLRTLIDQAKAERVKVMSDG
ncbi:MAG: hypothetical protein OEM98_18020, partial [Gammaproteobacteria bacterium]|nr:hypothetical protein [Gammaproteobacteria bacterium]